MLMVKKEDHRNNLYLCEVQSETEVEESRKPNAEEDRKLKISSPLKK